MHASHLWFPHPPGQQEVEGFGTSTSCLLWLPLLPWFLSYPLWPHSSLPKKWGMWLLMDGWSIRQCLHTSSASS
jgi:hypothetical protein